MAEATPVLKRDKLAASLMGQVLKVVDEGVGPLTGAREYAEARLRQQGDPERAIRRIVNETIASSGAAGFTTGLGGFVTLPLSLPANITGQAILNARMVAAIAHLRGWDLSDELVRNSVLITLAGGSPNAVLSKFGVQLGQKFAEQAIRRVPVAVVREINRRVGFMLLAKYGTERSALTIAKAVPFAGGVVGGAVDASFTKGISTIAKRSFHPAAGPLAEVPPMTTNATEQLLALADRAFEARREAEALAGDVVVAPSMPILYFGDAPAYFASDLRVVTVGLNPSLKEFPGDDPTERFPGADLDRAGPSYLSSLDAYFTNRPYMEWFRTFDGLLDGLGTQFAGGPSGNALHTDLCTPVATDPTWSGLQAEQRTALIADGRPLWHDLVDVLCPHIMLISVAAVHHDTITLPPLSPTEDIHVLEEGRREPYRFEGRWVSSPSGDPILLVFGRAAQTPFGLVSRRDQESAAASIRRYWAAGAPGT